nr:MAG TPA_asm: hypothetical protein [Bacteriophage sp.]
MLSFAYLYIFNRIPLAYLCNILYICNCKKLI